MHNTLSLGRFFGIRVGVHISWIVVFAFATVTIASAFTGISRVDAYALAVVCALALFASIVAHEFAHALVARRFAVRTLGITLFLFGGVASLESEPPTPRAEVAIALAGPLASGVLGGLAFGSLWLLERFASGAFAEGVALIVAYVAIANAGLAVFNLLPAFPMDGGRVVRAALWRARKSHASATAIASLAGVVFAALLVAGGAIAVVRTHAWPYGWYAVIGSFLLRAGWQQYRRAAERARAERPVLARVA